MSNQTKVSFWKGSKDWRFSNRFHETTTKRRANSHRRPTPPSSNNANNLTIGSTDADESQQQQQQQLFHTICAGNWGYNMISGVNWFVLQESVIDMFKNEGHLEDGKLRKTHEIVKSILESNFSTLVFDRFKSQLLPQAMAIIKSKIDSGKTNYIETLKQTWEVLYKQILPTLDCMLHQIETPKGLSLRKASLIVFRDHVLLVEPLEERLRSEIENGTKICDTIIHMILTVQDVCECFPPSKNKLEMERICALVVSPFLGYRGLFVNGDNTNPIVRSNEPELHAKPRSLEPITNSNQSVKLCVQAMLNAANDQKISSRSPEPSKESKPIGKKQSSFTNLNYLMARIYK